MASVRNMSVGITEYEVRSVSALGRVVGIQEGSLCIDVDMDVHSRTSLSSQEDACVSASLAYGMAASRYEDVVWKEFTGQDSISTVSIFEQAEKEGTALVTLNQKNYNETVSQVSADEDTLAAVKSAVDRGRTVLIPEREVAVNEWKGTGYLILNPETGSGNYMISGGLSGGSTSTAVTIAGVCAVIAQIAMVALLAVMMGSLLSALFGAALIVQVVYAVFLVMTLPSFLSMTARAGNLMEAVGRYAAGDTSYEEYILSEFEETTIDLAELVMYMAMFEFAMGKVLGGSGGSGGIGSEGGSGSGSGSGGSGSESGSGSGTGGSGSGSESGSGSGTGESGGDSGSSGVGEGSSNAISQADRIKIEAWDYKPSDELYLKYKDVFDNPKYYNQKTGSINWPENNGFASTPIDEVLQPGTRIDRYGSDFGLFTSPEGIPYEMRAVAPGTDLKPYSVFEVVEPINVKAGEIAPWFDEPGGGIQYLLPDTVDELLDRGVLRRIK